MKTGEPQVEIDAEDRSPIKNAWLWNIGEKKWELAEAPFNRYSRNRKPMNMQRLNPGLRSDFLRALNAPD